MDKGVSYEQGRQQGKDHDQRIGYRQAARLSEIIQSVEAQVNGKTYHENQHIQDMPEQRQLVLLDILVAQLVLMLERLNDAVGLFGHYLATVDNLLSLHHHTAGQGNTAHQVVLAGLATFTVVAQVGRDIVIQVTLLENGPMCRQVAIHEQSLIGRLG